MQRRENPLAAPPARISCVVMRLLLLVLALICPALSREMFVSDAEAFNEAAKSATAGDMIILQDGVWANARLMFHAEGTMEKPVTIKARTPGKVVLTGGSRLSLAGAHVVVEGLWFQNPTEEEVIELRLDARRLANDCRVTHCAVTNELPAAPGRSARFVSIYGARNRIDHCHIAGKTSDGTTLVVWLSEAAEDQGRHRIDHNHFGPRQRLGKNGGETIRLGDSKTSMQTAACVVEHNLFERCDGEAECISNKSCGNIYRFNTFKAVSGTLTLRHGNRCQVEGNLFDGLGAKGTGGVRVIGEDHVVAGNHFLNLAGDNERSALCFMLGIPNSPANGYFQVKRARVTGNIFVNCRHNVLIGMSGDKNAVLAPLGTEIIGNTIQSSLGAAFDIRCSADGVTMKDNQTGKEVIETPTPGPPEPTGPAWR